ncbi:hypothetical protein BJ508DRAFT_334799 [Ascobolus immersus RN42]|uniref:Uncharacterized protein n=1 Tax=Ascobolus immersus RN42 TaxID=1160509 RepID=A0A3N4HEQ4_ASCIM|nr:hypothetical protein BJ508DRAFT_334799 [Ascobolus immersus RN42]
MDITVSKGSSLLLGSLLNPTTKATNSRPSTNKPHAVMIRRHYILRKTVTNDAGQQQITFIRRNGFTRFRFVHRANQVLIEEANRNLKNYNIFGQDSPNSKLHSSGNGCFLINSGKIPETAKHQEILPGFGRIAQRELAVIRKDKPHAEHDANLDAIDATAIPKRDYPRDRLVVGDLSGDEEALEADGTADKVADEAGKVGGEKEQEDGEAVEDVDMTKEEFEQVRLSLRNFYGTMFEDGPLGKGKGKKHGIKELENVRKGLKESLEKLDEKIQALSLV